MISSRLSSPPRPRPVFTCVPGRDTPLQAVPACLRTCPTPAHRLRRRRALPTLLDRSVPLAALLSASATTRGKTRHAHGDGSSLFCGGVLRGWIHFDAQGRGRMWSSSQASTRGVVEMGRVEAGPSHFPKRPAPRNSARYALSLVWQMLYVLMPMQKGFTRSASSSLLPRWLVTLYAAYVLFGPVKGSFP
jgi:hypothetical protein